jgi:hypothetical protein
VYSREREPRISAPYASSSAILSSMHVAADERHAQCYQQARPVSPFKPGTASRVSHKANVSTTSWPAGRGIPRLHLQRALGLCFADRHRAELQRSERGGATHALKGSSAFSDVFEPDDTSKTCPRQSYLQRGSAVLCYGMMVCRAVRALHRGSNA